MSGSMDWHLFAHPDCGCYVAETLEEARALLVKDSGDEFEPKLMRPVADDREITVADADGPYEVVPGPDGINRIRYLDRETKTAKEWAMSASHKGYQFGGDA